MFTVAGLWHLITCNIFFISLPIINPVRQPLSYVVTNWYPNSEVTGLTSSLRIFLTSM